MNHVDRPSLAPSTAMGVCNRLTSHSHAHHMIDYAVRLVPLTATRSEWASTHGETLDTHLYSPDPLLQLAGARQMRDLLTQGAPVDCGWAVVALARTRAVPRLVAAMEAAMEVAAGTGSPNLFVVREH